MNLQHQLRSSTLFRPLLGPLGVLVLLVSACAPAETSRARPRVVLVAVVDTLSAVHVEHLGYDRPTTPNIDALAADGVTFEQAISAASYTVASIPSILTGRYPDRHGLTWYDRKLPEDEDTLPELLSRIGYESYAIVAVSNGGALRGALQGFDEYVEVWVGEGGEDTLTFEHQGRTVHIPRASELVPYVKERLDRLGDEERLFLYLHILEPHSPYNPPEEFLVPLVDERCPAPPVDEDEIELRLNVLKLGGDDELLPRYERLYDGNIRWSDHNLGLIIDELEQRGLYDEALIAITADHGEIFMSHGALGHGPQLYDEIMRVPVVIKPPASYGYKGLRLPQLASNVDVVPTICELLDLLPGENPLDGHSLVPLIENPELPSPREEVFIRARNDVNLFGLRTARHKAILHLPRVGEGNPLTAQLELYDIVADPGEQNDLFEKEQELAEKLRRRILQRLAELGTEPGEGGVDALPTADLELLEALGYTGVEGEEEGLKKKDKDKDEE